MKILVDTFETLTDKRIVQVRGGLVSNHSELNADFRVPNRFVATLRGQGPRLRLLTQHHPASVILASREQSLAGDFPETVPGHSRQTRARAYLIRVWWRDNHLFFDCSHSKLVPCATMGGRGGQRESVFTQNWIARKGAGGGWDTAEKPAHELPVNEAHAHSANAKAGQTPALDGADKRRNRHKRTTSCELTIKGQAVQTGARAVGHESHPEKVAAFPPGLTQEIGPQGQEDGVRVPIWTPQVINSILSPFNFQVP